jgi:DNA invertase Pin-like site-specific DNA recombinase
MKQREITAAIYLRLSKDDGTDAESNSIGNQRDLLSKYAQEHDFIVYKEYVDDGWSGTNFDRPAFKRMVEDIEAGIVGAVLIKDLSRLGRNNALVAFYTEMFFPDNDVRLIAINDAIDTGSGENEIMAFKSVINEYYARDISKKIRSARRTMAQKGLYTGPNAPYGYIKSPADKHRLIVDEEAAEVVKRMFEMAESGLGVYQIAHQLYREEVLSPNAYKTLRLGQNATYYPDCPHEWIHTTVRSILQNRVYVGDMVGHKQSNKSFKNHTIVRYPEEEWITVTGTHEPLVSIDTFERVQRLIQVKKRDNTAQITNIFAGLLKCKDCGGGLSFHHGTQSKNKEGRFICSKYRHTFSAASYTKCTAHGVAYRTLCDLTLHRLNALFAANLTIEDVMRRLQQQRAADASAPKTLERLKRRDKELKLIVRRIMEQNALGVLSQSSFLDLYNGYRAEQEQIAEQMEKLERERQQASHDRENAERFLEQVQKYVGGHITELSRELLLDLIDKIVVHEATGDYRRRTREQTIDFHYRFVGKLD